MLAQFYKCILLGEEILRKRKHGDINTPGPLVSKSLYEAFCEGEDAEEEVGRRQDVVTYE